MGGKMSSAFKIHKASNGQYYFVLEAENGEIVLESEMYMKKDSAVEGIESVRKNSAISDRFIRKTSNSGKPYFVLTAANNEPIGTGEMYSSKAAMEKGIESVVRNGPVAEVIDQTGSS
jgi:uncharacterized protein YegP (UPF0339 family)